MLRQPFGVRVGIGDGPQEAWSLDVSVPLESNVLFDSSEPTLSTAGRAIEGQATVLSGDGLFAVVVFERRLVSLVGLVFIHALDPSSYEIEGYAREPNAARPRLRLRSHQSTPFERESYLLKKPTRQLEAGAVPVLTGITQPAPASISSIVTLDMSPPSPLSGELVPSAEMQIESS